jgi:hypothetical protein
MHDTQCHIPLGGLSVSTGHAALTCGVEGLPIRLSRRDHKLPLHKLLDLQTREMYISREPNLNSKP